MLLSLALGWKLFVIVKMYILTLGPSSAAFTKSDFKANEENIETLIRKAAVLVFDG